MKRGTPNHPEDFLSRRGFSLEKLADKPHGTRVRYVTGCRCELCRKAHSAYEKARYAARRRGESNQIVSASPVARHLRKLRRLGVGYKAVAAFTGVAASALAKVLSLKKRRVRAKTARLVLACGADVVLRGGGVMSVEAWDPQVVVLAKVEARILEGSRQ